MIKESIVAFIDILGFSELMQDPDKKAQLRDAVCVLIDRAMLNKDSKHINFTQFSDCMVITKPISSSLDIQEAFFSVCFYAVLTQYQLLEIGVATRGAITHGDAEYINGHLFSAAAVRAYQLEKYCALYPRIILDTELEKQLSPKHFGRYLKQNTLIDNKWFIDFLKDTNNPNILNHVESAIYDINMRTDIDNTRKEHLIKKWQWLKDYIDESDIESHATSL